MAWDRRGKPVAGLNSPLALFHRSSRQITRLLKNVSNCWRKNAAYSTRF